MQANNSAHCVSVSSRTARGRFAVIAFDFFLEFESLQAHLQVVGMLRFMSDINQQSLSTSFYSVLVSISVFMALSTVFHVIHSPNNSPFSLCSSSLISALLVLSTLYLFVKVSFSPDIIPSS